MSDDDEYFQGVKITKLPPGKAYGSDDLRAWSSNRAVGASGVKPNRTRSVTLLCRCGFRNQVIVSRYDTRAKVAQRCRRCGKAGLKRVKKNAT